MLVLRSPDGLALVWGKWALAFALGLPVWWFPRWGCTADSSVQEWHFGWPLVCVGLLRCRGGRRWPLLARFGVGGGKGVVGNS